MSSVELPKNKYTYQNHSLDSTYWEGFTPRHDDIVIATPQKSGTTWMQNIVANLIFQGEEPTEPVWKISPWVEAHATDIKEKLGMLEDQGHRRFVKTHLPLDGLVYLPEVKYIYVGRDARDIFMSLWNHHESFSPDVIKAINDFPGLIGNPFPTNHGDIHSFFHEWITRGWFPWEREGYPYWSAINHFQTWFDYRHLPNILLVHFNDLLSDLDGEMRRISEYLGIKINEDIWENLVDNATFKTMKKNAEKVVPGGGMPFVGGAQRFLFKGTNKRWVQALSTEELELYDKTVSEILTPDCAKWLEIGRAAL